MASVLLLTWPRAPDRDNRHLNFIGTKRRTDKIRETRQQGRNDKQVEQLPFLSSLLYRPRYYATNWLRPRFAMKAHEQKQKTKQGCASIQAFHACRSTVVCALAVSRFKLIMELLPIVMIPWPHKGAYVYICAQIGFFLSLSIWV